ncbi:ankyrin repeat protein [Seminavis robusta]|uniref:Ankyrin repeat protein n=1 Tax=Seminavis robusta TaxID=568900 RepID=A0A9N8DUV0_9STRA|nr:ankyrin repeat protein [Seminavis robusta]|eukprot:Sro375_g129360.1 ankyrin repeat protein (323) ;mRNA; r:6186-7154
MNRMYKTYCKIELKKNPRMVEDDPQEDLEDDNSRSAEITDTLYSATFCNLPRAEYWLRETSSHETHYRDHVCTVIAKTGNIVVLKWARQKGFPWNGWTCESAAQNGHLDILKWARANGCPWDHWTCKNAARFGHLEVLKWAHENGCPWKASTCGAAARNGHLEVLKWARANGCPWHALTCARAAEGGHLEILQWLRENGCQWNAWTCARASGGSHLEILKWAHANGCRWDVSVCWCAAADGKPGNSPMVHEMVPWNASTCEKAALGGHLEILKWARANGCHGSSTCGCAQNGIGVLKWARANGCPWHVLTCARAAEGGHLEV